MTHEQIACICHEANRAYCESIADDSQKPWDQAADWQRQSALRGVEFALANPGAPPSAQHDAWMADKIADDWTYGPVKDSGTRQHPCLVAYGELPIEQQTKDHLFRAIVHASAPFVTA